MMWLPKRLAKELEEAERPQLGAPEHELRRQLAICTRALNMIQRGLLMQDGPSDWTRKVAKDALVEAGQEIWT